MIFLGIDTETTNGLDDGKDLTQSLVYDMGWQILDHFGNILVKRSFVIYDIFCEEKALMKEAFFADKIPQYWEDIKSGKRRLVTFRTASRQLKEDIRNFEVDYVFAHNSNFDVNALNNTIRWTTKSKYRYFFPYNTKVVDTLELSRKHFGADEDYINFCLENGYMTKHRKPQPRFTAEILHRYLSGNNDFEESHTGLEDVEIETEIFLTCYDAWL